MITRLLEKLWQYREKLLILTVVLLFIVVLVGIYRDASHTGPPRPTGIRALLTDLWCGEPVIDFECTPISVELDVIDAVVGGSGE